MASWHHRRRKEWTMKQYAGGKMEDHPAVEAARVRAAADIARLRDQFAMSALTGLTQRYTICERDPETEEEVREYLRPKWLIAREAYEIADAMMDRR